MPCNCDGYGPSDTYESHYKRLADDATRAACTLGWMSQCHIKNVAYPSHITREEVAFAGQWFVDHCDIDNRKDSDANSELP